jgi:hypothetical protein
MIYIQTVSFVFALMTVFILVRNAARRYAERHPEFGPLREEGEGCGCGNKRCGESQCKKSVS